MTKRDEKEHDATMGEAEYILKRWEFSISSTGLLWIQPTRETLSPEELAGMFSLLARGCESDMPALIKLDLSCVRIVGEQWTTVESLILDFAHQINAQVRFARCTGRPAASVMFTRETMTSSDNRGPAPLV